MAWRWCRCPSQAAGFLGLSELLNDVPHALKTLVPASGPPGSALGVSSVPKALCLSQELRRDCGSRVLGSQKLPQDGDEPAAASQQVFVDRNGVTSQTPQGSHWLFWV